VGVKEMKGWTGCVGGLDELEIDFVNTGFLVEDEKFGMHVAIGEINNRT
jgi:hypothetical protein